MTNDKSKIVERARFAQSGISFRAADAEGDDKSLGYIEGYAILFNSRSEVLDAYDATEVYEIIEPSAVTKELLDRSLILCTLYHDMHRVLARSKSGTGSLTYTVDDKGVKFRFQVPDTEDGRTAAELIRRGDIDGCSFAFSTRYYDDAFVERKIEYVAKKKIVTYHVKNILSVHDFTLTPNPAYTETEAHLARDLFKSLAGDTEGTPKPPTAEYLTEMREHAKKRI